MEENETRKEECRKRAEERVRAVKTDLRRPKWIFRSIHKHREESE